MELLIPGLILVALMVYASTKIKRSAAAAFEPETIETDEFRIEKPDGFLNVLNRGPGLELDLYSKEFGIDDASSYRAARAELRVYTGRTLEFAANAIADTVKVVSDVSEVIDGRKYRVIEAAAVEKGVGFREIYKLSEKDGRVFELQFKVLDTAEKELSRKVDLMFASFEVK